jgi:putative phosphotransacetylase
MGCGSSAFSNSPGLIDRSVVEQIVRQVALEYLGRPNNGTATAAPQLTVLASARHMHICREDMDILFGPGTELTVFKPLFQAGNFAANEKVTIIGPRSRLISNLRILGPMRKQSQIELAFTDAISLGLDIPVRLSGNIAGTPGAIIMGPKGSIELKEGIIRAAIHVHMNPSEAAFFGVAQGDLMKLRVGGPAGVTFDKVHVRIDPTSRLNVHMDTDEANACGLHLTKDIQLIK